MSQLPLISCFLVFSLVYTHTTASHRYGWTDNDDGRSVVLMQHGDSFPGTTIVSNPPHGLVISTTKYENNVAFARSLDAIGMAIWDGGASPPRLLRLPTAVGMARKYKLIKAYFRENDKRANRGDCHTFRRWRNGS